jgi:hypothetical protein
MSPKKQNLKVAEKKVEQFKAAIAEKELERAEEAISKKAVILTVNSSADLKRGEVYIIRNQYDTKHEIKRSVAVFDRIFTDSYGNVCALFAVDHNVFSVPVEEVPALMPTVVGKQAPISYSAKKLAKHYKKFRDDYVHNIPYGEIGEWVTAN